MTFNITMARTYRWQSEDAQDQTNFITSLVKLFRMVTGSTTPLQLRGVQMPDASGPCTYTPTCEP